MPTPQTFCDHAAQLPEAHAVRAEETRTMTASAPSTVEVWSERRDDGRLDWAVRVDGLDLGGGIADTHAACYQGAAEFLAHSADATIGPAGQARRDAQTAAA